MMNRIKLTSLVSIIYAAFALAHEHQNFLNSPQEPWKDWKDKYGPQVDTRFSGGMSFAHLPYHRCLEGDNPDFAIGLLGLPFDTTVSYRPGARFGPHGIRAGSRRLHYDSGYTLAWRNDPFKLGATILDCGDVPVTPFDNAKAVDQMEVAYSTLLQRSVPDSTPSRIAHLTKDGTEHPRLISLGGDHTIVLPILRALHKIYGPVSVIHFDAHLDTWVSLVPNSTAQELITHGSYFTVAHQEGLLRNDSNVHAGIRCAMEGVPDVEHDTSLGFKIITTEELDDIGTDEVIRRIRERVGDTPVYLSFDIDVADPGVAPATGYPEPGGWSIREIKRMLRGLAGLNIVGADIVEVAPAYDHAEITGMAAASIVLDFMSMMLTSAPPA